jgi:hypothetical protein
MKYLFAIMILVGACIPAHATTGNEVLIACKVAHTYDTNSSSNTELLQTTLCQSLIEGVMTTLAIWRANDEEAHLRPRLYSCIPDGVTIGQATSIFLKYAEAHPEALHRLAGTVIADSLALAYPCRK